MHELKWLSTSLLEVRISGFWALDDMRSYREDVLRELEVLQSRPHPIGVLIDGSDMNVQSQSVVAELETFSAESRPHDCYVATIVASSLARRQADRIMNADEFGFVTDARTEALAWFEAKGVPTR